MNMITPPSHKPIQRLTEIAAATLLTSAILSSLGCSLISQALPAEQPVRDAESGQIVEERDIVDVFAIRVGDCMSDEGLNGEEINAVNVVPCDGPHTDEVYHAFHLTNDEFPGEDMSNLSDAGCYEPFESFIGVAYESSEFDFWSMYPTLGSWSDGDREVLCLVYSQTGELSGSLQGAGR